MDFYARVRHILESIPSGRVATYGQIAELAGAPKRSRHVAKVLKSAGQALPWHRVLGAGGKIRTQPPDQQAQLLRLEGVLVSGERVSLKQFGWTISPLAFAD